MTPDLDRWLQAATLSLSKESTAQVRAEIQEHYESAREAAIADNLSPDEADRVALSALGDAKLANRQYRRVLLTASEAGLIEQGNRWVGLWPHWPMAVASFFVLLASAVLFWFGAVWVAMGMFALGLNIGFAILAPHLPLCTPSRGRVARCVRWTIQLGLPLLVFGPHSPNNNIIMFAMLIPSFGPFIWMERKRASIRRKLPVADWPRQLYL